VNGMNTENKPLLDLKNVKMHFPLTKGLFGRTYAIVKAVDGISFSIKPGETFGLVGESGCGKTTTGKVILSIYKPTTGQIIYQGTDIVKLTQKELRPFRRDIQLIFQDPYGSLDPRQSVFSIVKEAITTDRKPRTKAEIKDRVDELLRTVELDPKMGDRFPHEMSGGQRQRLGITRALACSPKLIVCDEPVSALDVSIQAQIINLFEELQEKFHLTYLFVAHDLAVVRHISNTIGVMYLGKIVEITSANDLYKNPLHPYTRALLSAIPITDYYVEQKRQRIVLQGDVPSPIYAPPGCPFHPRCSYATDICRLTMPELKEYGKKHRAACHNI
jgi:oligopeptide/dipeptide ABC transporter ATP-binding protein